MCAVLQGRVHNNMERGKKKFQLPFAIALLKVLMYFLARFPAHKVDCVTCGHEMVIYDARHVRITTVDVY